MPDFEKMNFEELMHDSLLKEGFNRKERLIRGISQSLKIPQSQLQDNNHLTKAILKMLKEYDPFVYENNEDVWRFLAENMEDEPAEAEAYREAGKNSFYNRMKAKEYIDRYWKNYNSAYPTFHGGGGDCANFVSQVLYAGGMPWVDDGNPNHYTWLTNWYCKPGATNRDGDRRITLTWKVAASFKKHWEKRAANMIELSYNDAINSMSELSRQVYIGDPIQFCYANGVSYHTLIVTGYAWDKAAGVSDIVLASHTIDSNRRSLYNTMLKYPRDYKLRMYVIKEGE